MTDMALNDNRQLARTNSAKLMPRRVPPGRKYWMRLLAAKQQSRIYRHRMKFMYFLS